METGVSLKYFVNSCSNGESSYSCVSGFDMTDHMVDLYHYLKAALEQKGFLKFLDMERECLGKYIATRCLSLENCVEEELKNYPALKLLFLSRK